MRWPSSLLATALSLALLTACTPPAHRSLEWAGITALNATEGRYALQAFHTEAMARVQGFLGSEHHLSGQPLTDAQVDLLSADALTALGQGKWLTGEELSKLRSPRVRLQWRQAFEGQSLQLVAEIGALVHQRQEAWLQRHGKDSPEPASPDHALPPQHDWDTDMPKWSVGTGAPLTLLTADETLRVLMDVRTRVLDSHTALVRPQAAAAYNEAALRTAHGVGLVLQSSKGGVVVESLLAGSPAEQSKKVRTGDAVLALRTTGAAWEPMATAEQATERLRAATDWVEIRLKRGNRVFEVRLNPTTYANNKESLKVHNEIIPAPNGQKIRSLRLEATFFYEDGEEGKSIADDMQKALSQARNTDVVVLDFRRARGGGLEEAMKVAGLFVEGGSLGHLRLSHDHTQPLKDLTPGIYWNGPVQIWVGPQTASSAELVAQTVRDRVRGAQVLGWPTYGKGTLQKRVEMDMGSARESKPSRLGELWYTVAEIYSPSGRSLQQQGVALDGVLPNPVAQPWGERALPRSLSPQPAAPEHAARPIVSAPALTPSTPDGTGLGMWRKAAGELLVHPAPGS